MGQWKIVSGGQTGVDRAALDAALQCGLSIGGWIPKGRLAEDGPLSDSYPLQETPSENYDERTEWNVRDSDGTLIIVKGEPTGGTAYTIEMAKKHECPYLIADLSKRQTLDNLLNWARSLPGPVINLAGPRESTTPGIYRESKEFLREFFEFLEAES